MKIVPETCLLLMEKQETLSVAESCTGGGVANEITLHPGISKMFLGGVVTYANEAKEKILDVPKDILVDVGAVSEEVALLMAQNCRALFSSTWALSITGIAGPNGGSLEKPVGLVWIGLCGPKILLAKKYLFENISRREHREKTIVQAFMLLRDHCSA